MKRYQVIGLCGALAVILGAFLPWFTIRSGIFTLSVAGTEGGGDGLYTAAFSAGVLAALFSFSQRPATTCSALVGLCSAGVAVYDYQELTGRVDGDVAVSPGIGLALTIAGGVAMIVAMFSADKVAAVPPPPPFPPPAP